MQLHYSLIEFFYQLKLHNLILVTRIKNMIYQEIPEINPVELLWPPYNLKKELLAYKLGVQYSTVLSWLYHKRKPNKSVRILAAKLKAKLVA